jgi:hypothetical protein
MLAGDTVADHLRTPPRQREKMAGGTTIRA